MERLPFALGIKSNQPLVSFPRDNLFLISALVITKLLFEIKGNVAYNQQLLEEYIRFKGALIELGRVGNAFTAELSNEELAFKENGQKIAFISNNSLVITNAEIRNKLSLGNETRGWFDFIPRANGNLSIKWRDPAS